MKKITLLFSLLIATAGFSQTIVNFDVANFTDGTGGLGFMNVFENPKDGSVGAFVFESGWGISDLVSVVGATSIELKPNRVNDPAPFWNSPGEVEGNKLMEANHFTVGDAYKGQNFTFVGNVASNTLNSSGLNFAFQPIVFIKVFNADFSLVLDESTIAIPASGDFSVSMDATAYNTDENIQYGFQVLGPNINNDPAFDTAYANFGGIVIQAATLSNDDFNAELFSVSPNPTRNSWNITGLNTTINTIEVFDILGKRVQTLSPNNTEATIDARDLKSGIYLAKMYSDNGTKTIKLVKE